MVADLNNVAIVTGTPNRFIVFKDKLFFLGDTKDHGKELWVFNGTESKLVADINPGIESSNPSALTVYQDKLYFYCDAGTKNGVDPFPNYELWVYDGISAPSMVLNINKGNPPSEMVVYQNKLYFEVDDRIYGKELWVYDGTYAHLTADIRAGLANSSPSNFTIVDGELYFFTTYTSGIALFKINNSLPPTLVKDLPNFYFVKDLTYFNQKFYFAAGDNNVGVELRSYDLNSAVLEVIDLKPGLSSLRPSELTVLNNTLFFLGDDYLWKYDGINTPVKILNECPGNCLSQFRNLTVVGSSLFVRAFNTQGYGFWMYNGNSAPMRLMNSAGDSNFVIFENNVYFGEGNGVLWKYNGVNELGIASKIDNRTGDTNVLSMFDYKDISYLIISNSQTNARLHMITSPNKIETVPELNDIAIIGTTVFKDKLFINGTHTTLGRGIWIYDGITLEKITEVTSTTLVGKLIIFKDKLYFSGGASQASAELWVLENDRTPQLVKDINPGEEGSNIFYFIVYKDKLYFSAFDGVHGKELWQYDGINPPAMLMDINPGISNSEPGNFAVLDEKFYFTAMNSSGTHLWVYTGEGQPTNTNVLKAPPSGPSVGVPNQNYFVEFKGKLYFMAYENDMGSELYSFDGSVASLVKDISPGKASGFPHHLRVYGSKLFFGARMPGVGDELFQYDGTTDPELVADIYPGELSSSPLPLTGVKNTFYFVANDGIHGNELWRLENVTGIEGDNNGDVKILSDLWYPNPTNDIVKVDFANDNFSYVRFTIVDVYGRVIDIQDAHASTDITVSLLDFSAGYYIIKAVKNTGDVSSFKVIKLP